MHVHEARRLVVEVGVRCNAPRRTHALPPDTSLCTSTFPSGYRMNRLGARAAGTLQCVAPHFARPARGAAVSHLVVPSGTTLNPPSAHRKIHCSDCRPCRCKDERADARGSNGVLNHLAKLQSPASSFQAGREDHYSQTYPPKSSRQPSSSSTLLARPSSLSPSTAGRHFFYLPTHTSTVETNVARGNSSPPEGASDDPPHPPSRAFFTPTIVILFTDRSSCPTFKMPRNIEYVTVCGLGSQALGSKPRGLGNKLPTTHSFQPRNRAQASSEPCSKKTDVY